MHLVFLRMFEQKLALVFIVGCHPTSFHETVEWWVFRAREGISRKMPGCPAIGSGKSPHFGNPASFYDSNSKSCSQEPRVAGATPACHTNKMLAVAQAAEQRCMQTSRVDFNAPNRCGADSTAS